MKIRLLLLILLFSQSSCSSIATEPKQDNAIQSEFERVDDDLKKYDEAIVGMNREFAKIPADINDKDWVRLKLSHMVKVDQYMRKYINTPHNHGYSDAEKKYFESRFMLRFTALDRENTKDLKELLEVYKWFNISEFGDQADKDA